MNFKSLFFLILTIILFSSCIPKSLLEPEFSEKSNLFLFLADDLSYFDLGITGNEFVNTPNIDAFAKDAIEFTKMYTPSAMCAPSRSALLTGLYPHRNGCHMNHGRVYEHVKSLPQYLRPLGYRVALVGKKHIKPNKVFNFDYVFKDSLENYLKKGGPTCVIFASNDPHGPHNYGIHPPEKTKLQKKWVDVKGTRRKLSGYYADIEILDKEFDKFLKSIENANAQENAVTIFTSDHGYENFAKWSCYEMGLNVPFFFKTTGIELLTKEVNQLVSFVDIVPTFIELAGGSPPTEIDGKSFVSFLKGKDESIHEFIYGAHTTRGIYSGHAYPIRSVTDGNRKYIHNLNHEGKFQNIITNGWNFDEVSHDGTWGQWLDILESKGEGWQWVEFYQKRPKEELYDLEKDPFEMNNLAENPEYLEIKNKLSQELADWMKRQGDTGMEAEMAVPLKAKDMTKVPKK